MQGDTRGGMKRRRGKWQGERRATIGGQLKSSLHCSTRVKCRNIVRGLAKGKNEGRRKEFYISMEPKTLTQKSGLNTKEKAQESQREGRESR